MVCGDSYLVATILSDRQPNLFPVYVCMYVCIYVCMCVIVNAKIDISIVDPMKVITDAIT